MVMLDPDFMLLALGEARRALEEGEIPVGSVVARDGVVLSSAHNRREQTKDPTAHAEILAIRLAAQELRDWRLDGCTLYVTLEPCPMCAAAIALARVRKLVFAAYDFDNGAVGSNGNVLARPIFGYAPQIQSGFMRSDAESILELFFTSVRIKRRGG